jgi:pimeloyl-ACP methyl ester carboxylesterase
MKRTLVVALTIAVLTACQTVKVDPIPGEKIGVVLMHGKWGVPDHVSSVADTLRGAGVLVETPEMPWSRDRAYAKSFEDSMKEIDAVVESLRKQGAKRILVGGHSMGANAALGYGARRKRLGGLILLAPGHVPGLGGFDIKMADAVGKARRLASAGKGSESATFEDLNQQRTDTVFATADIFLSWFDPYGPAVMATNAANVEAGTTVFCADGTEEPYPKCSYVESNLSLHPKNTFISVEAGHSAVKSAARQKILAWLRGL